MKFPMIIVTVGALALGAFGFVLPQAALAETGGPQFEQAAVTVESLAADLAGNSGASSSDLVAAARAAGLSDLQIADAFGRASETASDKEAVATAFEAFKETSELAASILDVAYSSGAALASAPAGDGFGGAEGGDDDDDEGGSDFDVPLGGSGGSGGSANS